MPEFFCFKGEREHPFLLSRPPGRPGAPAQNTGRPRSFPDAEAAPGRWLCSMVLPMPTCTACRAASSRWLTAPAPKWYLILTALGASRLARRVRLQYAGHAESFQISRVCVRRGNGTLLLVTGVGEMTKAVKAANKAGDAITVQKATDFTDDAIDIVKSLDRSSALQNRQRILVWLSMRVIKRQAWQRIWESARNSS